MELNVYSCTLPIFLILAIAFLSSASSVNITRIGSNQERRGRFLQQLKGSSLGSCPSNPLTLCDFYFRGNEYMVPILSLDGPTDSPASTQILDSKSGLPVDVDESGSGSFLCPSEGSLTSAGDQFYVTGYLSRVQFRTFTQYARSSFEDQCILLPITAAQVSIAGKYQSIYPGDDQGAYPESRRCLVFKTGPSGPSSLCASPPAYSTPPPVLLADAPSPSPEEAPVSQLNSLSPPCVCSCPSPPPLLGDTPPPVESPQASPTDASPPPPAAVPWWMSELETQFSPDSTPSTPANETGTPSEESNPTQPPPLPPTTVSDSDPDLWESDTPLGPSTPSNETGTPSEESNPTQPPPLPPTTVADSDPDLWESDPPLGPSTPANETSNPSPSLDVQHTLWKSDPLPAMSPPPLPPSSVPDSDPDLWESDPSPAPVNGTSSSTPMLNPEAPPVLPSSVPDSDPDLWETDPSPAASPPPLPPSSVPDADPDLWEPESSPVNVTSNLPVSDPTPPSPAPPQSSSDVDTEPDLWEWESASPPPV